MTMNVKLPLQSKMSGGRTSLLLSIIAVLACTSVTWAQFTEVGPTRTDGYRTGDSSAPAPDGDSTRLRMLGEDYRQLGSTPRANEAVKQRFGQYVGGFVDPENTLELIIDRPRLVMLKRPPARIQLPAQGIVAYQLLTDRELSLIGLQVGTTVMNLWFPSVEDPEKLVVLSYVVRVLPDPEAKEKLERVFSALESEINRAFVDSHIEIVLVGDAVLVKGQAVDRAEADQILRLISSNLPSSGATSVPIPDAPIASPTGSVNELAIPGLESYDLNTLTGNSASSRGRTGTDSRIVDMITIPGEKQIMLRVTIAEVSRSAARAIGLNFSYNDQVKEDDLFSVALGASGLGPVLLNEGKVRVALNALRNANLARTLAEPTLVTMNGADASFSAGGQFPVPVVTGATATGLQGVSFAEFGVDVSFRPTIIGRDRVRLQMNAETSNRDESLGASIDGTQVSGLESRDLSTTVEMDAGQTLAVAGLIQQNFGSSSNTAPGVDHVPVLGWLFGSRNTSTDEQELLMLVNVELIDPLNRDQLPDVPGAEMHEPDDLEFFLLGRQESHNDNDWRSAPRNDWDRLYAPRQELDADSPNPRPDATPSKPLSPTPTSDKTRQHRLEDLYIIGPSGHSND